MILDAIAPHDVLTALRAEVGRLSDGAKLPTVRRLMKQFGVGQGAVQRAVATLEAEGLVSAEVGRGTFVRRRGPATAGGQRSVVILNHQRPGLRGEMIAARLHEQLLAAGHRSLVMTYGDLAHVNDWLRAMPPADACVIRPQSDTLPAAVLAGLKGKCRAVVVEGVPMEHLDVDSVATDWLLAIETAIRHLRARRHERLALVLNDAHARYAREGTRLFKSLMRLAGIDDAPVAYLQGGTIDPAALKSATAVIAWGATAVRALQSAGAKQAMVAMENPDLQDESLAGLTIVGRPSARIAAAAIERIDCRLANPDATFAPVYDKPKLVVQGKQN